MIGLEYKDTIQIAKKSYNGYGDATTVESVTVPALFTQSTGSLQQSDSAYVTSDAQAYVDPENEFVKENGYRLEGMMVLASPFVTDASQSWYEITTVRVGQDKLLTNQIDNVEIFLSKSVQGA